MRNTNSISYVTYVLYMSSLSCKNLLFVTIRYLTIVYFAGTNILHFFKSITSQILLYRYLLITWLEGTDGETMYDVINAKTVVPPEDSGILDVAAGMIGRISYTDGCYYKAKIVDKGNWLIYTLRFSYM